MRKVCIAAINSKYSHSSLALRYFKVFSGCKIFEASINDDMYKTYCQLISLDIDILGFSTYIWNIEYTVKLASMLKETKPALTIIFGGPESGYNAEETLKKYDFVDAVISGEGEMAVKELCDGKPFSETPNLIYRQDDKILSNETCAVDLSLIKFPYTKEDLELLKNKIIYFETSRGCIYNCSYCLSSSQGKTRYFDMNYVLDGINFFIENKVPLVKFVDRTFNDNNERACTILRHIVDKNISTHFHFEIAPQLITDEFCEILSKANGFIQIEAGIQTLNPDTMKAIKRIYNPNKVKENISKIPKSVHIHTDLIAGLPFETLESFKKGFDYAYSMKPDMLQLGFLKLLHNTKLKSEAHLYNIKTTSFAPYEVLSTDTLTAVEIMSLKKTEKALDKYYNSGIFKRTLKHLDEKPFEFFSSVGEKLWEIEKTAPLSKNGLYLLLYNLYGEKIKLSLCLDYIENNPKTHLPDELSDKTANFHDIFKHFCSLEEYANKKIQLFCACGKYIILCDGNLTVYEK